MYDMNIVVLSFFCKFLIDHDTIFVSGVAENYGGQKAKPDIRSLIIQHFQYIENQKYFQQFFHNSIMENGFTFQISYNV